VSPAPVDPTAEWLEADGLGCFASGTVGGERRRRYHGILQAALTPPTGRVLLLNGYDAWIERADGSTEFLTVQRYAPDASSRDFGHLSSFQVDPWPTWTYRLADGTTIEHELFVPAARALAVLRWRAVAPMGPVRLVVRPFLSGRDIHALHHENPAFRFDADLSVERVCWQPYPSLPPILAAHDGAYAHRPVWYRAFQLDEERARGFDHLEDAGSPGTLSWDLARADAICIFAAGGHPGSELLGTEPPAAVAARLRRAELLRRRRLGSALDRAADTYLVGRGDGHTIIAGYPWFTDWGRDTFIALRGLCLATGRLRVARSILGQWAGTVSRGMLPNRFPDDGGEPEFNSVDASLWFVVVVGELLAAAARAGKPVPTAERRRLEAAVVAILEGYERGTRYGIGADEDGLLRAGVPGVQLTWMDAKIGDWVVTPRIGKPVEVQALWINALRVGAAVDSRWGALADRAQASFAARFWNPERSCLFDVVDSDGVSGRTDATLRPNQIFAVGGLPHPVLSGTRARAVVDTVEHELLTPLGLRSLGPAESGYQPRYEGGPRERDAAYHQGTVWPWLLGAWVEAWLRVVGDDAEHRAAARRRFLEPVLAHRAEAGLGHVSEIADAEPPHTPRGCPFQAWSVGEILRLERLLAKPGVEPRPRRRVRAGSR
jgi:predicted glycogen debranching enzyme